MILIAETFNAGTTPVRAALQAGDRGWVEVSLRRQLAAGVDLVECNASGFGDEEAILRWLVETVEPASPVPLSLDSADPQVLAAVATGRRRPPLLNSVDATGIAAPLADAVRAGASIVVQLRRGDQLPRGCDDRLRLAEAALAAADRQGLPRERIWIDPGLLPWGDDVDAGRPLLAFLESFPRDPHGARTLVGLSNVSWGHPDRRRVNRDWLRRLRDAGLGGAILDPFDRDLLEVARA